MRKASCLGSNPDTESVAWASDIAYLNLSLYICNMGITITPTT